MGNEAVPSVLSSATSIIRETVADGVVTFTWVFGASTLGTARTILSSSLGLQHLFSATFFINVSLVSMLLIVADVLRTALGGASFNPTITTAFYTAGLGADDDLFHMAFRFPAQAAGAIAGAVAIGEVMPMEYKHMIGGPRLNVGLHTGAVAEAVLTFLLIFAVLWIATCGPENPLLKTWMTACTVVVAVNAGSGYTGPSMNPASAFGWAFKNNHHNTWEHYYVYWVCPFLGSILAAIVFRLMFLSETEKRQGSKNIKFIGFNQPRLLTLQEN